MIYDLGTYYTYDHKGSTVNIYNEEGNFSKDYTYDAYGVEENKENRRFSPYGYCGEYTDYETGFVYLRNRYYKPEIGRFISEDPARAGFNWYVYCENNPIMYVDPWGLDSWVYYDGRDFSEQAKTEADVLGAAYGTEVHLVDIWSLEGFVYNWNRMINNGMIFHSNNKNT